MISPSKTVFLFLITLLSISKLFPRLSLTGIFIALMIPWPLTLTSYPSDSKTNTETCSVNFWGLASLHLSMSLSHASYYFPCITITWAPVNTRISSSAKVISLTWSSKFKRAIVLTNLSSLRSQEVSPLSLWGAIYLKIP